MTSEGHDEKSVMSLRSPESKVGVCIAGTSTSSVCLSVYLSVSLFVGQFVCLPIGLCLFARATTDSMARYVRGMA